MILNQVESALLDDEAKFEKALEFHDRYRTLLRLPKFRIESTHDLKPVLQALGLGNIFSADADFSGIVGRKDLTVDQVCGLAHPTAGGIHYKHLQNRNSSHIDKATSIFNRYL